MLSRSTLLAGLFTVTLSVGGAVLYFHDNLSLAGHSRWTALKEIVAIHHGSEPQTQLDNWGALIPFWSNKLTANKELVLYGALAFLALSMIALVIGATAKKSRDPKDSMLEVLKEEKKKAENLAKIKADFLNHVSHELRTPLAVIIGYVECITDGLYGDVGAKHQEILEIVAKQSSHLKEMIDQILIYSRLESNRQSVKIQEFGLSSIINELKDTFGFLCSQKELELCWDLPSEPVLLRSDPDTLKEILSNLLQNAVKYTDEGSITVRVERLRDTHSIGVEVADTGMGIPETYLATIFEPFIQVHKTSTERSRGGIGLGLSIVKRHVEHIKGRISVQSEVGVGSTFRITIPERIGEQPSREKQILHLLKFPYFRPAKSAVRLSTQASPKSVKSASQAVG
jgi:signal transduction histidine kinase